MDSLALLCNLYGDGPATVRRLREAGLGSLQAIDAAEAERLASLLRTSVRSAQRFQAEGRLLLERTTATVEPAAVPAADAPGRGDPLLRKVLDAWRRKDAEDAEDAGETTQADEAGEDVPTQRGGSPAASHGAPDDGDAEVALAAGDLDGLDAAGVEALARAEVTTLDQLARCEALAVAARSGLPYTRLLRLALLARRSRADRPEADPAGAEQGLLQPAAPRARPARDPRFSPSEAPSTERDPPLEPIAAPRVDRRAAAGAPTAPPPDESLESAGPFA